MTARAAIARGPSVATTMTAAAIDRFGPPQVLASHTLPVPTAGPSDVLIALDAAGVGMWDGRIRDGSWATGKEHFPLVLGTDGAGTVVGKGARVRRFQIGDRVWAYQYNNAKGGFYAQYVAVNGDHVGRVPRHLSLIEAGAGVATGLTALQGIAHLHLTEGNTVLIFGASGAVGTLAIQFARHRLARVLATASGPDASALVRQLGADAVLDARREDVVEQLQALAPDGIDAVLALAGGEAMERSLGLVRPRGRLVYPNGVEPEPQPRPGVRVVTYDAVATPRKFAELERVADQVQLRVPIASRYPLAAAAKAHERLEQSHVLGRIVFEIKPEDLDFPTTS
jgi:NADPH:quinone reductase